MQMMTVAVRTEKVKYILQNITKSHDMTLSVTIKNCENRCLHFDINVLHKIIAKFTGKIIKKLNLSKLFFCE